MNARSAPSAISQDTLSGSRRQRNRRLFVAVGLAGLAIALLLAAWSMFGKPAGDNAKLAKSRRAPLSTNEPVTAHIGAASADLPFNVVDDDGQSLWVSPTDGKPLDLAYLPPGAPIIVALRSEELASQREGGKILAALGPMGRRRIELINEMLARPQGVNQAIVALSARSDGSWQTVVIARLSGNSTAEQHVSANLPDAAERTHAGIKYFAAGDRAYYAPAADPQVMVVGPAAAITEIIDLRGDSPPLRREVERLLSHTDQDRHFTIILTPNFLFSEGQGAFAGQMAALREPLFWFLGDELGAVALSMHWNEDYFVEVLAVPTSDTSPDRAAQMLAERVAQVPDRLEKYEVGLATQPYGRRILARFPAMVRKLAAYIRSGFESDHAVLRCYLPAIAGHNLLMGTELTLAESLSVPGAKPAAESTSRMVAPATAPKSAMDVRERLQRNTSLSFPRDTLEAALEQLGRDTGINIVIAGADLQAEGITKNQSFGINLSNQPAEDILVEVLRLANPDKAATAPGDIRQKLVYVISGDPAKPDRIVVTTRAAAAARGDELPRVFRPN